MVLFFYKTQGFRMLQITKCSKNHIIKKKSALIYKLYKILNKLNINNLSQNKNREKNNLIITLQNGLSLKNLFQNKNTKYITKNNKTLKINLNH